MSPRVVLVDNYDSFVYNIYQLVGELTGVEAEVVRNDRVDVEALRRDPPTHLIISPGPGNPVDPAYFGRCRELITTLGPRVPILGVCLGHQGLGAALGAEVVPAPALMHGKTSPITHDGRGIFAGLPASLEVMRYHSLVLDPASLPACLEVSAWTEAGEIMGLRHRTWPSVGIQFHPESIGTALGARLLGNWLGL